ncbi:DMT family transporter [Agrobacterium tumefaciens]|uniref:DMT family transporter n=1 Tax=Agrobacterium tumefaciens TaxID=358 RepID=UPI0021D25D9E|nr:DMT family transporter [Agrobacterium tumefaciens]UXS05392.1 DMT family transporter [Agrobacterium tumefaciens]
MQPTEMMRLPTSSFSVLLLIIFAVCRGSAYSLTTVALAYLSSATITFLRLAIAAAALLVWACWTFGDFRWLKSDWKPIFIFGIFGNSLPNGLITVGQETVPSGLAAVMMALIPIFSAIMAHICLATDKLTLKSFAGVLIGFFGVFTIVRARSDLELDGPMLPGLGLMTIAALSIALSIVSMRFYRPANQKATASFSLLVAAATLAPFVSLSDFSQTVPTHIILICLVLGLVCHGLAWIVMIALSQRATAAFASSTNYLIPVVGLMVGAIFLSEPIFWTDGLAFGLIIGGTALLRDRKPGG